MIPSTKLLVEPFLFILRYLRLPMRTHHNTLRICPNLQEGTWAVNKLQRVSQQLGNLGMHSTKSNNKKVDEDIQVTSYLFLQIKSNEEKIILSWWLKLRFSNIELILFPSPITSLFSPNPIYFKWWKKYKILEFYDWLKQNQRLHKSESCASKQSIISSFPKATILEH